MNNTILPSDNVSNPTTPSLYTRWLDVTISHIEDSNPLRLTFCLEMILNNGTRKHSSKSVTVTDVALQERFHQEVKSGDRVRICLETDWDADTIPTVLKDFCLS